MLQNPEKLSNRLHNMLSICNLLTLCKCVQVAERPQSRKWVATNVVESETCNVWRCHAVHSTGFTDTNEMITTQTPTPSTPTCQELVIMRVKEKNDWRTNPFHLKVYSLKSYCVTYLRNDLIVMKINVHFPNVFNEHRKPFSSIKVKCSRSPRDFAPKQPRRLIEPSPSKFGKRCMPG